MKLSLPDCGIKMHTLCDLESQIPTFFHITSAMVHDTKAMDVIPYEENSFYIFDIGYNDFKPMRWKHNFPPESIRYPVGCRRLYVRSSDDGEVSRQDTKKKLIFFLPIL